jgi:hypothetical protein
MNANYEYFVNRSLQKYAGDWVIIAAQRVIAHGPRTEIKAMLRKAKRDHPKQPLFVAKVSQKNEQVL